ncbi:MAG: hypothetical protein HGA45_30370 [Chloroflexales bacterium]|nr:hypothetical protein [Chloroflexales bacterium]
MLFQLQSFLIGLIGWAATVLVIENATRLTLNDRRAMIVCSWMLWMIPAFGALVLRGLITTDIAALYVGLTTGALGLIMLVGAITPRTRP